MAIRVRFRGESGHTPGQLPKARQFRGLSFCVAPRPKPRLAAVACEPIQGFFLAVKPGDVFLLSRRIIRNDVPFSTEL
jgi:hypothetical protein